MSWQDDADSAQQFYDLIFDDGSWFRVPYVFIRRLSWTQAAMLAYLVNQSNWIRVYERRKGRGHLAGRCLAGNPKRGVSGYDHYNRNMGIVTVR